MPESFHLIRPAALLLAPVVLFVWWLWQRQSDPLRGWRSQVEPELLEALVEGGNPRASRSWPALVAWLLAVLAIAGPAWKPEPNPFAEDAAPLIILLKTDVSMDTPDPEPSRIERAHLKIRDLAAARKGEQLGLIAYAGSAHLVLPPTKDTEAVATMATEVTPKIMPSPGDRLDLAINLAGELIGESGGTLLVITDTSVTASDKLSETHRSAGRPFTQILTIAAAGAPIDPIKPVAKSISGEIIPMTIDDTDIDQIIRRARRAPVARSVDGEVRWQDGGYVLLPFIAIFALIPFRRESSPNS